MAQERSKASGGVVLQSISNDEIPTSSITSDESRKLFRWNLSLGLLHLLTGAAIMVITDTDATAPVYTFFPDPDTRGISDNWSPDVKFLYNAAVGYLSGITLLIASLDHLLVATIFRKKYEWFLARNRNPFRWIEYGFSASFMHVLIGQLSGVFSIHLLWSIWGFTCVTMIFGNEMELANCDRRRRSTDGNDNDAEEEGDAKPIVWRPFLFGWIPHMFGWAIVLCFFFQSVTNGDPPGFVYAIIFVLFFLDLTFPIVQFLQQRGKGKFANYVHGEIWFCILSLASKQLLAWINYGGTASLNSDDE